MAGTDGAATLALDGFRPVAVAEVESELARRMASAEVSGKPVLRTCALNLVVYIGDAADARRVSAIIDPIAAAHPMRVIMILLDRKAPEAQVGAWVDIACGEDLGSGRLCSEQVALAANPDAPERVVSALLSVLSADLPVALWWRAGSPFLSRLFKGIAPLADKIIVDSVRFGDGPAALDTLHRLTALRERGPALADMNWHRTASWRSTLSACFDDPAVLPLLPELDRSEIEFSLGAEASSAPPSARSLLLAGWLVSRMPSIAGHGDISGSNNDWASPGAIVALRLRSSTTPAGVTIKWMSAAEGIKATAYDRWGNAMRRWQFSPDPESEADLLFRCIDSTTADPLLEAALRVG